MGLSLSSAQSTGLSCPRLSAGQVACPPATASAMPGGAPGPASPQPGLLQTRALCRLLCWKVAEAAGSFSFHLVQVIPYFPLHPQACPLCVSCSPASLTFPMWCLLGKLAGTSELIVAFLWGCVRALWGCEFECECELCAGAWECWDWRQWDQALGAAGMGVLRGSTVGARAEWRQGGAAAGWEGGVCVAGRGCVGTRPEEVALFCGQGPAQQSLGMQLCGCAPLAELAGSRIELAVFRKVPPATSRPQFSDFCSPTQCLLLLGSQSWQPQCGRRQAVLWGRLRWNASPGDLCPRLEAAALVIHLCCRCRPLTRSWDGSIALDRDRPRQEGQVGARVGGTRPSWQLAVGPPCGLYVVKVQMAMQGRQGSLAGSQRGEARRALEARQSPARPQSALCAHQGVFSRGCLRARPRPGRGLLETWSPLVGQGRRPSGGLGENLG